jgi:hypothetical protein
MVRDRFGVIEVYVLKFREALKLSTFEVVDVQKWGCGFARGNFTSEDVQII